LPALAAELVEAKPDVLVTYAAQAVDAVREATSIIPIVMAGVGNALGPGYVASLARPGGNITGLTLVGTDQAVIRLQLLQQIAPGLMRVAVLWNPNASGHRFQMKDLEPAAPGLGVVLQSLPVQRTDEIDVALRAAIQANAQGVFIMEDPMIESHRLRIAEFTLQQRLPAIGEFRPMAVAGALMSYGPTQVDLWRRAASYVDKILKGAKPADLPVEQPIKYELVINLKTAKAFGLTVPADLLVFADEVIQ